MSLTSTGVRRLVLDRTVSLILNEARKGDKADPIMLRALEVGLSQMGPLAQQAEAEVAEMIPEWRKTLPLDVAMHASDNEVADDIYARIVERREALEAGQPPPSE